MGTRNAVAIRLATEGKSTVIRDFDEIGAAGESRVARLRAKWESEIAAASRASERAAQTEERLAAATPQTALQSTINANAGSNVGFRGADRVGAAGAAQDARASAAVFIEADRAAADYQHRAVALMSAIDPMFAAQRRFDREMLEARTLLGAGAISAGEYALAERTATAALAQASVAQTRHAATAGNSRIAQMELMHIVRSSADSYAVGLPPMMIFTQHLAQLGQALSFMGGGSGSGGAAAEASASVTDLKDSVGEASESLETAKGAAASLAGALGAEGGASERSGAAATGNAAAHGGQARATVVSAAATEANTVALGGEARAAVVSAAATEANTIALGANAVAAEADAVAQVELQTVQARLAAFMGGPWGIALIGGVTVLGSLLANHFAAAGAAEHQRTAEDDLREAIEAERRAIQSLDTDQAVALRNARLMSEALEMEAQRHRDVAAAVLQQVVAQERLLQSNLQGEDADPEANSRRADSNERLAAAESELATRQKELTARQGAQAAADLALVRHTAENALDVVQRTADRFAVLAHNLSVLERHGGDPRLPFISNPQAINDLRAVLGSALPPFDRPATHAETVRAENALAAARREAARTAQQAAEADHRLNDTRETGRHITSAEAIAMVRAAGGHVTSAGRPTWIREETPGGPMSQERLYDRYLHHGGNLAARPGTGNHEYRNGSQGLDITGMSLGQVRELFRANGVHLTELINEGDHVHAGWGRGRGGQSHEQTLARENAARVVNTAGLLAEADAYLRSSEAGARAVAQREGLTAATRQGADTDARARQQMEHDVAQAAATGAQHVAQLRDETAARQAVIAQVAAGTLAAGDMQQAMQDDAALRPMLVLQAQAHGEALATLTRVITAYRAALHDAHAEEAHSDALGAIARLRADNDNARSILAINAPDEHERALQETRIRAMREAKDRDYSPDDATAYADQRVQEAHNQQLAQAAEQFRRMNADADDRVALLQRELSLGGMGEQQRAAALRIEQQRLQLERQFGPEHRAEIEQILGKARAEEELQRQVERVRDAQRELQQVGGNVIDQLFNIDNIHNWGDAAMRVLRMVLQEMLTLGAANPLKNRLFGENNPTLSSLFSLFSGAGAAGGGGAGAAAGDGFEWLYKLGGMPGFATGTESAPGGMAWVGENGPEPVFLPRGSKVGTAAAGRRMMAANDSGALHYYDLRGAVVTEDLMRQMEAIAARNVDARADEIAQRGARMVFDVNDRTFGRAFGR